MNLTSIHQKAKFFSDNITGLLAEARIPADALEEILHDWAYWIKPYVDAGHKQAEVVPLFQEYVAQQFTEFGISDHAQVQYESANPSYMSVFGLMRYWKKKSQA